MNRLVTFLISSLTIFLILTTYLTGCSKSDEHVADALARVEIQKMKSPWEISLHISGIQFMS